MVQSQISIRKSKDKHHKTSPVLMDLITSQKFSVGATQSKARQAPNFWLEKDNEDEYHVVQEFRVLYILHLMVAMI